MDGLLLAGVLAQSIDIAGFFRTTSPHSLKDSTIWRWSVTDCSWRAVMDPKCASASAWDVSDRSLAATRECLSRLGVSKPVALEKRSIYSLEHEPSYSSIVVSEVLEHLEDPAGALAGVRRNLRSGGRAFLNVPCNSPAPDHIHLFSHPDEFYEMVEGAGFAILRRFATPGTGWTMERALRQKLTVSCAVVVTLP